MNNWYQILLIALVVLVFVLFILITIALIYWFVNRKNKEKNTSSTALTGTKESSTANNNSMGAQSIFKFMEFDKIEDNMIIQKKGNRFLMVVECQGVNYDLMSGMEKVAVEEGFIQFLNTLRYPIQIYVQTRKVNLEDSIERYKSSVSEIQNEMNKLEMEYQEKVRSGRYDAKELEKEYFELTKKRNLYEYGQDVINNTEKMSLNKNILNKNYYIIIPYSPEEIGDYDKEEIKNMAFGELYTRAQSVLRTLAVSGINGYVLDSNSLTELLYIAYNRDESEVFSLQKALAAGFDELYSTAPDVLDRKIYELDKQIEEKAIEEAQKVLERTLSEKEKAVKEKEETLEDLVNAMAIDILESNKRYVGKEVAEESIKKLRKQKTKGEEVNGEDKPEKRTRRIRKGA